MKQETNNEIDLLLRRLGRRQGVPATNGDSHNDSDHLDADELSSYAENVLPAASRARYTEHLAQCSRCRELVVQLSGSVTVVAAKEPSTVAGPSALAKFLANLFSPMVLRYAAPALVLIVAAAIGVVVLRSNRPGTSVAELRQPQQPVSTAPSNEQPFTYSIPPDTQAPAEAESPTAAAPERRADVAKDAETYPAPPNAAPAVGAVRVEPKVDASTQKAEEQAAVANPTPAPAQPAAPKPGETDDQMRVEAEGRRANVQRGVTDLARAKTSEVATAESKKAEDDSDKRQAKAPAPSAATQGGGRSTTFSVADEEAPRSVAGRRFRKLNGVWVDTAYAAGSATTNIARGSEQYRGLIADEPEIKTIAEQLDGQIIVVWKGRAYRIR
jgi:hypothetical protein